MKRTLGLLATIGLSLMLTACGGSSTPKKPTAAFAMSAPTESTFSLKDGNVKVNLDASTSTTPRDANLTYAWQMISRPDLSMAELANTDEKTTDFTADLAGDYVVSLIVNDGKQQSEAKRMTITATSPYPVAHSETNYSVTLGTENVGLDASKSTLPTGKSGDLVYQWTLKEKPADSAGYISNSNEAQASINLDLEGEYKLELVVKFEDTSSKPVEVTVKVASGNAQPMAKAEDMTVTLGKEVVIDGSASSDPEGESLQYRWSWSYSPVDPRGVPVPELFDTKTDTVRFTPVAAGEYKLKFFVFDGERKSEDKEVTITVEKDPAVTTNQPPVGKIEATGYFPSYSVGEQEVGRRAEFNFVGYDPEGEPLQIVSAELIEKPADSTVELVNIGSWKPLGKKIQKLDVVGKYSVRMTISDGVNQITAEANMQALIGQVNSQPSTRSVDVKAQSVLVGEDLVFDASSSDRNGDPMTFHWELADKPDGSKAVITPVIEPESGELRRAVVKTDVPGSYTARLIVEDDRGLRAKSYEQDTGFAKTSNTKPEIRSVVWARNWGRLNPGENYYQILPCMSLLHRPVVVDSDGDEIDIFEHTENELIKKPEGGEFTSSPSDDSCANTRGKVFTKPGEYTFRYYATDLIDDADPYDFVVKVDSFEDAKGVRLRNVSSSGDLWHPLPYENKPPYGNVFSPATRPIEEDSAIAWALEAVDGDYTIENVKVSHINGGLDDLTPRFENLEEGQVIKKGETLEFKTWMRAIPCVRTEERGEGFHFSFNIKEIPEITFVYENWLGASNSSFSKWEQCTAGQIK
ncbi:PKD domain-containing protein [Psychrobium sp. MM17-31]|uniref:PKD domain-containing protein n=1 Tax=Psychrobium sp. MM17-31 TaxID=2917758 RepID=UPI001EF4B2C4|nr:PKD domain-containing protein [Psychrobium sp. MM17-31]MCG7532312.1 PKD domain-containing protein [Psychrobium sp. MM17-31]